MVSFESLFLVASVQVTGMLSFGALQPVVFFLRAEKVSCRGSCGTVQRIPLISSWLPYPLLSVPIALCLKNVHTLIKKTLYC